MKILLNTNSVADYRKFLRIKSLPAYSFTGREASVPDEYAARIAGSSVAADTSDSRYAPPPSWMFDYQRDITRLALRKQKFAVFADCGLGKSLIEIEFAREAINRTGKGALIVTPAMVVPQFIAEIEKFYGDTLQAERVTASQLPGWLATCAGKLGITNWEAMRGGLYSGQLGAIVADESSLLKSHYGAFGQAVIELGRGLEYKLCGTGTPAPNDRIEYANHAVFLDRYPTVNAFLARYFINRGQTNERWELRPYALKPFYRSLSDWCIFLNNPATYGWKDNVGTLPPIHVHVHQVEMTSAQSDAMRKETRSLFAAAAGGITKRHKLARIAKGGDSLKYDYMRGLIASWPEESTIAWCWFNEEQDRCAAAFSDLVDSTGSLVGCASISGDTPMSERIELIGDFKARRRKVLVSKPKVLGYGLNLQVATRQVFSSLIDSYESYYQAIKRSNRVGSTRPLNVHIPVLDIELPMFENVLRKADRVAKDTEEQESLFREFGMENLHG